MFRGSLLPGTNGRQEGRVQRMPRNKSVHDKTSVSRGFVGCAESAHFETKYFTTDLGTTSREGQLCHRPSAPTSPDRRPPSVLE